MKNGLSPRATVRTSWNTSVHMQTEQGKSVQLYLVLLKICLKVWCNRVIAIQAPPSKAVLRLYSSNGTRGSSQILHPRFKDCSTQLWRQLLKSQANKDEILTPRICDSCYSVTGHSCKIGNAPILDANNQYFMFPVSLWYFWYFFVSTYMKKVRGQLEKNLVTILHKISDISVPT